MFMCERMFVCLFLIDFRVHFNVDISCLHSHAYEIMYANAYEILCKGETSAR
jgi:hypothetical protein